MAAAVMIVNVFLASLSLSKNWHDSARVLQEYLSTQMQDNCRVLNTRATLYLNCVLVEHKIHHAAK